jgi:hypothetical protein
MAKKPEPPKLFWLTYRLTYRQPWPRSRRVVIESRGLLHARLKASPTSADQELEFASGHQLDPERAGQIRFSMRTISGIRTGG